MIPLEDAQPIVLADFSGGLDTKSSPPNTPANASPYVLNMHTNTRGSVEGRNGRTALESSAGSGNANGLYHFAQNATLRLLMQLRGTTLQKMEDLDGTWDTVTQAAAFTDATLEFDTFDLGTGSNRLLMASHSGSNMTQYWDGSGSTTQITDANWGTPKYIKVWQQRIWGIGSNSDPNNLRWTDSGSSTVMTAANNLDIITNDGDYPTGIALLKKSLYIFKRFSIHRITYTGGDPIIEWSPVILGTGCASSKTLMNINIPDIGEALAFMTMDGRIVAYTGHSEGLFNISDVISADNRFSPVSMARVNRSALGTCHSVVLPQKFWYVCFVPMDNNGLPTHGLVYDYLAKSWWPWSNQTFGASAQVLSASTDLRIYGQGHSTAKTYRLDYGNDDDGTTVNRVFTTGRLHGQSTTVKSGSRGVQVILKQTGDYTVGIRHRADWSSTWSSTYSVSTKAATSVLGDVLPLTLGGDDAVMEHLDIPQHRNLLQIQLTTTDSNPPWALYRVEEISQPRGIQP